MNCLIIRGTSGSGKTTLAQYIQSLNFNADIRVCTADDFFVRNGQYEFDASKLGQAHGACQAKFRQALEDGVDVVVANTSTARKDRDFYADLAKAAGYRVFSIVVENLGTKDVHSVPVETLERQKNILRNNVDF
jgi:predicted kinase